MIKWQAVFRQANIADLIILAPFSVPIIAEHYVGLWRFLGDIIAPENSLQNFSNDALLFVNLAGAFAVFAVLLRMRLDDAKAARATGYFKLVASAIFAIAVWRGGSAVFVIPLVADLVIGSLLIITTRSKN